MNDDNKMRAKTRGGQGMTDGKSAVVVRYEEERSCGAVAVGEIALSLEELGDACVEGRQLSLDLTPEHWRAMLDHDDLEQGVTRVVRVRLSVLRVGDAERRGAPAQHAPDCASFQEIYPPRPCNCGVERGA